MTRSTIYRTLAYLAMLIAAIAVVNWFDPPIAIALAGYLWGGLLADRVCFRNGDCPLGLHCFAMLCATAAMAVGVWQGWNPWVTVILSLLGGVAAIVGHALCDAIAEARHDG